MRVGFGGAYPSQQYRTRNEYFPRYTPSRAPESNRFGRTVAAELSPHKRRIPSGLAHSERNFATENSRDFKGRDRVPENDRDEGRRYIASRDDPRPSHSNTGRRPSPILGDAFSSSAERSNRYKYLNEGWFSAQKSQYPTNIGTPPQAENFRDREHRESRADYKVHSTSRSASDRYRYEKSIDAVKSTTNLERSSYINPDVLMETRQLEERVAAIQRELDMLENDNAGSRSSEYRGSRNAHPKANISGNLPSLLDFAAPPESVEKARLEREEVNLRLRERELFRREQELLFKQRHLRIRTPPRYGRVVLPRPPRIATFPKSRKLLDSMRRSTYPKRVSKPMKSLPARSEKRSTRRSTHVPEKVKRSRRNKADVECKEEHDGSSTKKNTEEEGSSKKLDHDRAADALITKVIGKDEDNDLSPRARAVVKLLEFCDKDLLMDEVCGKIEALCPNSMPLGSNGCVDIESLRTYNPTTLGPLDQYVPLRTFEEEVKIDSSDEGLSTEVLKSLQAVLEVHPRSQFS